MDFITSFLAADIRMAVPIFIAALGLVYSECAGVVNIGAEGIMLIGALAGFVGSWLTGSPWIALLIAMAAGALVGAFFAFMVVSVRANQTVVGVGLNIFGSGITVTLNRLIFGMNMQQPRVNSFSNLQIPVLSDIPVVGDIFFKHNILVYIMVAALILANYVLFKTRLGLKIRAVGEQPKACDTLGINVYRIRYGTILYSTMMCALAGAYMSLAQLSLFIEGMVSGRGFIALAAVVFGKWKPAGVLLAALVFGAGEALQIKLQTLQTGIPYQFAQMVPYLLTIFALVGVVGKSTAPLASGQPYIKE
ncbi:MAG: ABC transporter permease [Bacillota bacterium]